MLMSHLRSLEIVVPRNLDDSTAVTVVLMMVRGERWEEWGCSTEVYCQLYCLEGVYLQAVMAASGHQLHHLLCVCRLIPILDQTNYGCFTCEIEELHGGACGSADTLS